MKRVLLIYTELLDYRLPIFTALGSKYDLTVTHAGAKKSNNNSGFKEIILPANKLWRLRFQKGIINLIKHGQFDTVIFFGDIAWLSTVIGFYICPENVRRVTWGFWLTQNYFSNRLRLHMAKKSDSNLFYNNAAARDFCHLGVSKTSIEVALNTILVNNPMRDNSSKRDSILVVGTLNSRKNNFILIQAFNNICDLTDKHIKLVFIGDGVEREKTFALAQQQKFYDRIEFHPYETRHDLLSDYYRNAVCAVSYGQAGLSILQSFGHGVPFITMRYAISGGEIENVLHGITGFLCEPTQTSLEKYLLKLCIDTELAAELGENALNYYKNSANISAMIAAFSRSIEPDNQEQVI